MGTLTTSKFAMVVPLLIWTVLVTASALIDLDDSYATGRQLATQRGRDLFQIIQITRLWNASHGGVYVEESENARPNPYLTLPDRDITSTDGKKLTMINPAYMTRQISELAATEGFHFHITSNKPLRPENSPDSWEQLTLNGFASDGTTSEAIELFGSGSDGYYRYMAPLYVKPSCMKCHEQQGYAVGDIRGGISINISGKEILSSVTSRIQTTIVTHALVWLLVSVMLVQFFRRSSQRIITLEMANEEKTDVIEKKEKALRKKAETLRVAQEKLKNMQLYDQVTGLNNRTNFDRLFSRIFHREQQCGHNIGAIFIEIDNFKQYNDIYGHIEGDGVLRVVGNLLKQRIGDDHGITGRYVNASYVVATHGTKVRDLEQLCRSICDTVKSLGIEFKDSPCDGVVSCSIGAVYGSPGSYTTEMTMLKEAATALGKAKAKGCNSVVILK